MTKQLIIGLATIAVTGATLLATGMYASTDATNTTSGIHIDNMRGANHTDMIATLSGKVSAEALTAFQALVTQHKTEIDVARSNSGTALDRVAMQAQQAKYKSEMDALMVQYPELKTAMPTMPKMGKMGGDNGEFASIFTTLPTNIQTELKTIREEYRTKQDTLRTEEKSKIDTILAKYPDVKAKLDTLRANGPQKMERKGQHARQRGINSMMNK